MDSETTFQCTISATLVAEGVHVELFVDGDSAHRGTFTFDQFVDEVLERFNDPEFGMTPEEIAFEKGKIGGALRAAVDKLEASI